MNKTTIARIKKEGREIRGLNGILGWKLGKETAINYEYPFPEGIKEINIGNIDDIIREEKRKNKDNIVMTWNPTLFEVFLEFVFANGWLDKLGKRTFKFMGVTHKKKIGVESYLVSHE